MGKLGVAIKNSIAPRKQINKLTSVRSLFTISLSNNQSSGTTFSLVNSCAVWMIKANHSIAPKLLAWDLSVWKFPLISWASAQIGPNNQTSMIPQWLTKSGKEKEDKWRENKTTKQNPCQCTRGAFRDLCIRRQKPLTRSAQPDAVDSPTFAADFSQLEFLSLKRALSFLNSKQQNKLAEESLHWLWALPSTST